MKTIWKLFYSRNLVFILLALIIISSILGTVIQQNAPPEIYLRLYGSFLHGLFELFGIIDIYHSWWFITLLFLLSANIVVCSINRLPKTFATVKKNPLDVDEKYIIGMKNSSSLEYKGMMQEVIKIFSRKNYKIKSAERDGKTFIIAEKGILGRFGSFIAHLSVVVILAGAVIGSIGGFREDINIYEKEVKSVSNSNFKVRLDKFEIEYYGKTERPKEYKSTLTIIEQDKEVFAKTIEVNYPLKYKGIYFYQATYGQNNQPETISIHVDRKPSLKEERPRCIAEYKLKIGERFFLPNTEYQVQFTKFVSDFLLDENKKVISASDELKNPAVLLSIYKAGKLLFDSWCFPDIGVAHIPENFDFNFFLSDMSFRQYSGLQVVYDPGVRVVWAGCAIMVIGMIISFYISHKRICLVGKPAGKGWSLQISGNASKNHFGFEKEFNNLVRQLKER